MKKLLKSIVVVAIVLCFALTAFTGCKNDEVKEQSLAEKYGVTFKDTTVGYTGEKQEFEVNIDKSVAPDAVITTTYTYSGETWADLVLKDAGKYEVVANISVEGDTKTYTAKATYIIEPIKLTVELGNQFLRQGKGLAELADPEDFFDGLNYAKGESKALFGDISYEFTKGGKAVEDLAAELPAVSVDEPISVGIKLEKTSSNYEITYDTGKLYVLSPTEYDRAKMLVTDIEAVPTSATIDTYNYYAMDRFVSAATSIIKFYPSTSDIQKLMCGLVDVDTVKALNTKALDRIKMVYDLKDGSETAVSKIVFLGANHNANANRVSTDDDYIKDFDPKDADAVTSVEYGDDFGFVVYAKQDGEYLFKGVEINGQIYEPVSGKKATYDGKDVIAYYYGRAKGSSSDAGYEDYKNFGVSGDYISVTNALLGALNGYDELEIIPIFNKIVPLKLDVTKLGITGKTATELFSELTITAKGSTIYDLNGAPADNKTLEYGTGYTLTYAMKTGYALSEIKFGDVSLEASDFTKNKFEFVMSEDYFDKTGSMSIIPQVIENYSTVIKIDGKTCSHIGSNGTYNASTNGSKLVLTGLSNSSIGTIPSNEELRVQVVPDENYILSSFAIYQEELSGSALSGDEKLVADLTGKIDDDGYINIDLTDYKLDSTQDVILKAEFKKIYYVKVTSDVTNVSGFDAVTNVIDGDEFVSDYGTLQILHPATGTRTSYTVLNEGSMFYIKVEPVDGYVPKTIKINGVDILSVAEDSSEVSKITGVVDESFSYDVIKNGELYVTGKYNYQTGDKVDAPTVSTNADYKNNVIKVEGDLIKGLDAGEEIEIEIEYQAYYLVKFREYLASEATYKIPVMMEIVTDGSNGYEIANTLTNPDGYEIDSRDSALIMISDKNFYCYHGSDDIGLTIVAKDGEKFEEISLSIGNSVIIDDMKTKYTDDVTVSNAVAAEDVVVGEYTKPAIVPGDTIDFIVEARHYYVDED